MHTHTLFSSDASFPLLRKVDWEEQCCWFEEYGRSSQSFTVPPVVRQYFASALAQVFREPSHDASGRASLHATGTTREGFVVCRL